MSSGFTSLLGSVPALNEKRLKGRRMEAVTMEFRNDETLCLQTQK